MISFLDDFSLIVDKKTVIVHDNAPIHRAKKQLALRELWKNQQFCIVVYVEPNNKTYVRTFMKGTLVMYVGRLRYPWPVVQYSPYTECASVSENVVQRDITLYYAACGLSL